LIENLDLSVEAGDYLCIVGENGSGKSTLMKTIVGLLQPIHGSIDLGEGLNRKELGYLPQQTQIQMDFPASVKEIVLSGCLAENGLRPFYQAQQKQRALAQIERLGLGELKSRCYRELSGGQQQRVLLARALCATQRILFLDEPITGLDPGAAKDLYETIQSLNNEGIAIVMVSHDVEEALAYASHVLHLQNGKILFSGKACDYNVEVGLPFVKEGC